MLSNVTKILSVHQNNLISPQKLFYLQDFAKNKMISYTISLSRLSKSGRQQIKINKINLLRRIKLKSVAFNSQGSHTRQFDFFNWLAVLQRRDNVISVTLNQVY